MKENPNRSGKGAEDTPASLVASGTYLVQPQPSKITRRSITNQQIRSVYVIEPQPSKMH